MVLLLNFVADFYRIAQHLERNIYQSQESTFMCSYRAVYRFLKANTIFFPISIGYL